MFAECNFHSCFPTRQPRGHFKNKPVLNIFRSCWHCALLHARLGLSSLLQKFSTSKLASLQACQVSNLPALCPAVTRRNAARAAFKFFSSPSIMRSLLSAGKVNLASICAAFAPVAPSFASKDACSDSRLLLLIETGSSCLVAATSLRLLPFVTGALSPCS